MDARSAENIKQLLSDEAIIEFLTKQVTKLRDDIGDELAKAAAENGSEKIRFRLSTKFTPELLDQLSDDLKAELRKHHIPDQHQSLNDYVAYCLQPKLLDGFKLEPISITSNSIIMRCTDSSGQQSVARIYAEQVENKIPEKLEKYMIQDENQSETNRIPYKYYSTMALAQSDLSGAERENAFSISSQLVDMMLDFKSEGVCFYDIKPGNFLIMPNGEVKIGDKKSIYEAKRDESISGKGYVGTPQFEPPEMFNESGAIVTVDSRESYAIGLSLYLAFVDANAHKTRDEKTGEHTFDFTHPFFASEPDGPLFKCIIQGLTQVKPENRLSMESVQYIFSIYKNDELNKHDKMKLIHALSHPNASKRIRDEDLTGLTVNDLSSLVKSENIYLEIKLRELVKNGSLDNQQKEALAKRFEKIQDRDYLDIIFDETKKIYTQIDKQHIIDDLLHYQTVTTDVRYDRDLKEKRITQIVKDSTLTNPDSLILPMVDVQLAQIDESKNDLIGPILQRLQLDHGIEINNASFTLLNENWKLSQIVDKLISHSQITSSAELDALIDSLANLQSSKMDLFLNLIPSGIQSNLISLNEMSTLKDNKEINDYIMLATRLNNIKDKNPTIITWLSKGIDPSSVTGKLKDWGISPDAICTSSQAKSLDKSGAIQKNLCGMLFNKAKEMVEHRSKQNGVKNYGDAGMIFAMLLNQEALLKMDEGMKKTICHYLLKHHQFSRNAGLGELIKPLMKEIGFDRQQLDSFIKSNAYQLARNVSETVDSARKMVNNLSRKR